MTNKIDLHAHTTASDGTNSPADLVSLAYFSGLDVVAISDHDTVAGIKEAMKVGKRLGVEVIPAVEVTTKHRSPVHLLGYFVDTDSPVLEAYTAGIIEARDERNLRICSLMQKDDIPVSYDEMKKEYGDIVGRPHFAEYMVENGYAHAIDEAFDEFFSKGSCYYVPRDVIRLEKAISIVLEAGGVPVIAHPFQYRLNDAGLRELLEFGKKHGLMGLECHYSGYSDERQQYLEDLADEYSLLKTGGSDYHGDVKPAISLGTGKGDLYVPPEWLEKLREAAQSLRSGSL